MPMPPLTKEDMFLQHNNIHLNGVPIPIYMPIYIPISFLVLSAPKFKFINGNNDLVSTVIIKYSFNEKGST